MDKTFMRFDVSTQKSDDCERVKEDSVWRERERMRGQKEKR